MNINVKKIIFAFEKQCNPFKYHLEDYCIWPVFRFSVAEWLKISGDNFNKRARVSSNYFQRWLDRLAAIPNTAIRLYRARSLKDRVDFFCITSTDRLRDSVQGSYKNCYFDFFDPPIAKALFFYEITKHEDRLKPDMFYLDDKLLPWAGFFSRSDFKRSEKAVSDLLSDLNAFLTDINFSISKEKWYGLCARHIAQRTYFNWLLTHIKPSLLLLECAYGKEGAIIAAKSLNIPVWELQHGIIYDGHMAYTYSKEAFENKDALPLPDKILTFGEYFSGLLSRLYYCPTKSAVAIGFSRLEFYKKTLSRSHSTKKHYPLKVLISSQWILVDHLSAFLKAVLAVPLEGVQLIVKPHPLESSEHIKKYSDLGKQVKIAEPTDSFYELLAEADVHCGVFSTTLFESIGMEVPTIVLQLDGYENALDLCNHGAAIMAKTPSEFKEVLTAAVVDRVFYDKWCKQTAEKKFLFWQNEPCRKLHILLKNAGIA